MPYYLLIAALLAVAIAVQVAYLRVYAAQVTGATRLITGLNIGLLSILTVGMLWLAYAQAVK